MSAWRYGGRSSSSRQGMGCVPVEHATLPGLPDPAGPRRRIRRGQLGRGVFGHRAGAPRRQRQGTPGAAPLGRRPLWPHRGRDARRVSRRGRGRRQAATHPGLLPRWLLATAHRPGVQLRGTGPGAARHHGGHPHPLPLPQGDHRRDHPAGPGRGRLDPPARRGARGRPASPVRRWALGRRPPGHHVSAHRLGGRSSAASRRRCSSAGGRTACPPTCSISRAATTSRP